MQLCPIGASSIGLGKYYLVNEHQFFSRTEWNNFLDFLKTYILTQRTELSSVWQLLVWQYTQLLRLLIKCVVSLCTWGASNHCIPAKFRSFSLSWKNNALFSCGFLDLSIIVLYISCCICWSVNNYTNPSYFVSIIAEAS